MRVLGEILVTAIPFAALWLASLGAYSAGQHWLSLLIAVPAAAFLVRLFMIQHDCGHGSFVANTAVGNWIGRTLGVLTLTPYSYWKRTHAVHHATCGNLDRRGIGDIDTLTVREYAALSRPRQIAYRMYRHPLVLFGLGPAYLFFIQNRFPARAFYSERFAWTSTQGTNLAIAVLVAALIAWIGVGAFVFVHLPIMLLAASIGVWLFYVQHQFEDTSWEKKDRWSYVHAALRGSSYYDLPRPLHWMTANIGIHHVHHLCSRIPYYQLGRVMRDFPQLAEVSKITIADSLRAVRLTLWDEDRMKLVPFAAASSDRKVRQADMCPSQQLR